jgi:hypothetical protein
VGDNHRKNIRTKNVKKEIRLINKSHDFNEIYEIFEDVIGNPTEENVKNILLEYEKGDEKTLDLRDNPVGYFTSLAVFQAKALQNHVF